MISNVHGKQTSGADFGTLTDYRSGEAIRPATREEGDASLLAADVDGGHGIIEVEIDGATVSCFVS